MSSDRLRFLEALACTIQRRVPPILTPDDFVINRASKVEKCRFPPTAVKSDFFERFAPATVYELRSFAIPRSPGMYNPGPSASHPTPDGFVLSRASKVVKC